MEHLMRFENGKSYELYRCKNCYQESKKTILMFDKTKTEQQNKSKSPFVNKNEVKNRKGFRKNPNRKR